MLSDVFSVAFRTSSVPDVALFKRFQKQWPFINREVFTPASDDLFSSDDLRRLHDELYYDDAMKAQQPRDDYLELLHLSWTFLGGAPGSCVKFRAPGAMHHARWMAKAIYSLKIYMFQDQFVLTAAEKKGVTNISLFVALIYSRYWNEASLLKELLSMMPDFLHRYRLTHFELLGMPQQRLSIATFGTSRNI